MIVGFSLEHAEADKKQAKQGELNINYRHDVTGVEEASVSAINDPVARIRFSFKITYRQNEEDVATINFDGNVLWQQNAEQVIETWDESGELDDQVSTAVANHIFRKCLTQAVGLADSLDMPSPVPMPKVGQ